MEGFVVLNEKPKMGADNKMVCFLHPRHTNGVLVELCMSVRHYFGGKKVNVFRPSYLRLFFLQSACPH
jgi:hypothetical protein